MTVFFSHSSKDKDIVQKVFDEIGPRHVVYDSMTFEGGKRSGENIFRGISQSDIFILFFSRNSISSKYVKSEIEIAFEQYVKGNIKKILIFKLDESTHKDLPEYLQDHTMETLLKPSQIARRIRSAIIEIKLKYEKTVDIFIGREKEVQDLQSILTLPSNEMYPVISISGWDGIGRRTLARHCILGVLPYFKQEQPIINVFDTDTIEDLHRKLYDSINGFSKTSVDWKTEAQKFSKASSDEQIKMIVNIIMSAYKAKEIVFIIGDAGIIQQNGDYHFHIKNIIKALSPRISSPVLVLIHRRRIKLQKQQKYKNRVHFCSVGSLSDKDSLELLSAHFKKEEVEFTRDHLDDLIRFVGGHPENIQTAAKYAKQYGLEQLIAGKRNYIDIVVFHSMHILNKIEITPMAKNICAALLGFKYLEVEDFLTCFSDEDFNEEGNVDLDTIILEQLRELEDNGILERTGKYYTLSPFLINAIERDLSFHKLYGFKRKMGDRILQRLKEVSKDENIKLSLINAATIAAIEKGEHKRTQIISQFLLPSHLLLVARQRYDAHAYSDVSKFCKEALEYKEKLTIDAQIEAYRLFSQAAIRRGDKKEFEHGIKMLSQYRERTAKRNYYFLIGYKNRLDGFIDEAEKNYKEAYLYDSRNFSILRELSHSLSLQGRYIEAENYARIAYEIGRTNPFIVDILTEILIEKTSPMELSENTEIKRLLYELQELETTTGRSFYYEKIALYHQKLNDYERALEFANKAVDLAPDDWGPRVTRINLAHASGNNEKLDGDLAALKRFEKQSTDRRWRFVFDKTKVLDAISKYNFVFARNLIDRAHNLPEYLRNELRSKIDEEESISNSVFRSSETHDVSTL